MGAPARTTVAVVRPGPFVRVPGSRSRFTAFSDVHR